MASGSWNLIGAKFVLGSHIPHWAYVVLHNGEYGDRVGFDSTIIDRFRGTLRGLGIDVDQPTRLPDIDIRGPTGSDVKLTLANVRKEDIDFLLIILRKTNDKLYKHIKTIGDKELGLHTVCVDGSKIGNAQTMANVAAKINLKLGGVNQRTGHPSLEIINENKTMVVGFDVTHPSPGSSEEAPSIGAMVASIDANLAQWPVVLQIQKRKSETGFELGSMLKSRLELWRSKGQHQELPENILVYHDGVAEG